METVIEDFKQLSKEEKLKEGIIVIYNRTITSMLLCEFINKILTKYDSLEKK